MAVCDRPAQIRRYGMSPPRSPTVNYGSIDGTSQRTGRPGLARISTRTLWSSQKVVPVSPASPSFSDRSRILSTEKALSGPDHNATSRWTGISDCVDRKGRGIRCTWRAMRPYLCGPKKKGLYTCIMGGNIREINVQRAFKIAN